MVDLDVVAVAAAPTVKAVGNSDHAICGGEDRRTLGAGDVGAGVGADFAGDGVYAVTELRCNCSSNGQWPLQSACRGTGVVRIHKAFRAKNFRLEPRPKHLFGGHTVVGEKTTSRKRRSAQDAHPANFFGADIRLQGKVDAYCHADRQHRANELPRIQPEKDVFVVVADFFRYFNFYTAFPLSLLNRLNLSYNSCILYVKEALNYGY